MFQLRLLTQGAGFVKTLWGYIKYHEIDKATMFCKGWFTEVYMTPKPTEIIVSCELMDFLVIPIALLGKSTC